MKVFGEMIPFSVVLEFVSVECGDGFIFPMGEYGFQCLYTTKQPTFLDELEFVYGGFPGPPFPGFEGEGDEGLLPL